MRDYKRVGISEFKVSQAPGKLIIIGLGSCVGIAIYDSINKIGGLSHILLPDSRGFNSVDKPEKFADLAIPIMVEEISQKNKYTKLVAKIAGGASMFPQNPNNPFGGIGEKNVEAVLKKLEELKIPVIGENTRGIMGRTMSMDLEKFEVKVITADKKTIIL